MPASKRLLTPDNSALILIDHQPQMLFGIQSHDRQLIINNTAALARAAKVFNVPTILTTIAAKTFSGLLFPEIRDLFPEGTCIDRTNMNSWEDDNFLAAVRKSGRKKLVMAGLWTEVCLALPAIHAVEEGYEVYAVADASGGVTLESHELAMHRMIQAGVVPVTWIQVMTEWQRDWAREQTADQVREIFKLHGGAFGHGVIYAKEMWGAEEGKPAAKAAGRRQAG